MKERQNLCYLKKEDQSIKQEEQTYIICQEIKTEKNKVTIFSAERKNGRVVKNEEENQRVFAGFQNKSCA